MQVRLHRDSTGGDEATELAIAHALVRRASRGEIDEALRIYRPAAPAVVFGRRDTRLSGFDAARRAAVDAGFQTAVRAVGGRAVAYTEKAIVIDHVRHEPKAGAGLEARFAEQGANIAALLRGLGVDAQVGAVPGEYCPGAHSVNARGTAKLVGTAQRVVSHAWLFSTLVIVDDDQLLRAVLDEVYGHLGLAFDAASVGSVRAEAPTVDATRLEVTMSSALGIPLESAEALDPETLSLARVLTMHHRC